jgi:hypothetical protein
MSFDKQILGTVISSILDYDNLIKITGDPKVIDPAVSAWVPADGRPITGSLLHQKSQIQYSPDLRGKFLRGLNLIYSVGQPDFKPETEGDPNGVNRKPGSFQEDILIAHNHPASGHINGSVSGSNGTRDVDNGGAKYNSDPNLGDRNVVVTVGNNSNGGLETRPRNIAVYYYVKIN